MDERGLDYAEMHGRVERFVLRAEGHPEVRAESWLCIWPHSAGAEFYLRVPERDFSRMKRGVRYELSARNEGTRFVWKTEGVYVTRR